MKNSIIYTVSLLLLLSCGTNNSSDNSSVAQAPLEIGIEMPKVISISDDELREYLGVQEKVTTVDRLNKEDHYKEIKPMIWTIEQLFNEAKFTITITNSLMGKIEEHCKEQAFNEPCIIPKETITFLFSQENIDKLIPYVGRDKIGNVNQKTLLGEVVFLGNIEFVRYDEKSTYAYALMIDNSEFETKFFSANVSKEYKKTIKWSKDTQKVFYGSSINHSSSTVATTHQKTFYYQNNPNIAESTHMTFFSHTLSPPNEPIAGKSWEKNYVFDITKEHNSTNTLLKMYTMDKDEVGVGDITMDLSQKYTHLYIADGRGYLYTDVKGQTPEIVEETALHYNFISERYQQIFDKDGLMEDRRYCPEFDGPYLYSELSECSYEDPLSWFKESNHRASNFEPFEKFYFRELDVAMQNSLLKSGEYFLVPPDVNISKTSIEEVLQQSVGSFIVYESFYANQGFIYKEGYGDNWFDSWFDDGLRDRLDALQIVRAKYNQDLNTSLSKRKEGFEVIKNELGELEIY